MQKPVIHLNGTSARMLARGYAKARIAAEDALLALAAVEFNGRDYYPSGPDAWRVAQEEHEARLAALRTVISDLSALERHCCDHAHS